MKCISCDADIPSVWVAALSSNCCPGCSGPIYSEQSKQLMDELREAMSAMQNADAPSIAGWLLDNYQLTKIGDAQPVVFHRKQEKQVQQRIAEKLHPKLTMKKENDKNFRDIVAEIQSGNLGNVSSGIDIDIDNELPYEVEGKSRAEMDRFQESQVVAGRDQTSLDPVDLVVDKLIKNPQMILSNDQKPLNQDEIAKLTNSISGAGEKQQILLDPKRMERLRKQSEILSGNADESVYKNNGAIRRA